MIAIGTTREWVQFSSKIFYFIIEMFNSSSERGGNCRDMKIQTLAQLCLSRSIIIINSFLSFSSNIQHLYDVQTHDWGWSRSWKIFSHRKLVKWQFYLMIITAESSPNALLCVAVVRWAASILTCESSCRKIWRCGTLNRQCSGLKWVEARE